MQDLKTQHAVESDGSWHFVGTECNRADPLDHGQNSPVSIPRAVATGPRLATGGGRSPHRAGASGFAISARRLPSKYLRINSRLRPLRRILKQSPLRLLGITVDRECCAPACSREASCPNLNACRPSFHSLQLSAPPVRSARPRCCSLASSQHGPGSSTCIRLNALSAIRYLRPLPRLKTP